MAKTIKKEDIDEKAIIASFAQDEPTDHESLMQESVEERPSPQTEAPKEESRRRKSKEQDYESLFVRDSVVTARTGKMVYIRQDFHDTIMSVCQIIGKNQFTISGYIDNVLAHHFDIYGDEISRLYNERHKGIKIIKNS